MHLVKCVYCASKKGVRHVLRCGLQAQQRGLRLPPLSSQAGIPVDFLPRSIHLANFILDTKFSLGLLVCTFKMLLQIYFNLAF